MTNTRNPMRRIYLAAATVGATVIVAATAIGALGVAIGL